MGKIEVKPNGEGIRVAVIASRFNKKVSSRLFEGCLRRLQELGCEDVDTMWVPGAFEIPLVARTAAQTGRYQALVALGAVIRGETSHFDYVCGGVADGLGRVILDTGIPVAFGVLTTETAEQALERAAGPGEPGSNKGVEAAEVALEMANLVAALSKGT